MRFVACTFNLWESARWPDREPSMREFLALHEPDILCVQELRSATRNLLDDTLTGHARIDDPCEGWLREGNIYWNRSLFSLMEYGAEEIGTLEPLRRLFWARLAIVSQPERTLFVGTAHFTYRGNKIEREGGPSARYPQAQKAAAALAELIRPDEPALFMGDLNDDNHPIRLLRESGLQDSFRALGLIPEATYPALPFARDTPQAIDWMLHRGPIRPMTTGAVTFYKGELPPSDHKPLITTYRLL